LSAVEYLNGQCNHCFSPPRLHDRAAPHVERRSQLAWRSARLGRFFGPSRRYLGVAPRIADIPAAQKVARRIAGFLRFMRGRVVSSDMLVEYVYGDRPNGPPKHPVLVINMTLRSLRARGYPVGGVGRGFAWHEGAAFTRRHRLDRLDATLRRDDASGT
jgi:hypothetical protein